ncbi:Dimeric alpha-beta barrel [Metarhizium album ARSEF 1941]|uniref:Dimeric alpha-beta barrel n=1 Tax=Metarhizium album (strain ARSEF 1941) TaxID=1081103 RepID=A0A0B2WPH2_METAS|nr:Dimeric alpha-beta barrel [Metarhizium album ARSEF 1941]KHN94890.1 Dimeric alpha-beta barrel [Metarhizium album ARSEF 1941]
MAGTLQSRQLYAITIFGYKKEGMDEKEYHDYVSKNHAGHLKALLAKNDIVSYTMQHNTTETRALLQQIHPGLPTEKQADCDMVVQIVFRDIQDYLRVRQDPHWLNVVNPDHVNFADGKRTKFATGWYEVHVTDGVVVSQ